MLFATHSLEQVEQECDLAVWWRPARCARTDRRRGDRRAYRRRWTPRRAAPHARAARTRDGDLELRRNRFGSQEATLAEVGLRSPAGDAATGVLSGSPLSVELVLACPDGETIDDPIAGVTIVRAGDGTVVYDTSTAAEGVALGTLDAPRRLAIDFERLDLLPGDYFIDVGLYRADWKYAYDFHWHKHELVITGSAGDSGVFRPPHGWREG